MEMCKAKTRDGKPCRYKGAVGGYCAKHYWETIELKSYGKGKYTKEVVNVGGK